MQFQAMKEFASDTKKLLQQKTEANEQIDSIKKQKKREIKKMDIDDDTFSKLYSEVPTSSYQKFKTSRDAMHKA